MKRAVIGGGAALALALGALLQVDFSVHSSIAAEVARPCTGLGDINTPAIIDDHPQACRMVDGTARWVHQGLDLDADVTLDFDTFALAGCATLTAQPAEFAGLADSRSVRCWAAFDLTGGAYVGGSWFTIDNSVTTVNIKVCSLTALTNPPSGVFSCTVPL